MINLVKDSLMINKYNSGGLAPPLNGKMLPVAHNGCLCFCHDIPGVRHMVPCCYPSVPVLSEDQESLRLSVEKIVDPVE